jgi:hypothetical protein
MPIDVYAAMAVIPLAAIGVLWLLLKLADEPDAMDDAHGDVPEVPHE